MGPDLKLVNRGRSMGIFFLMFISINSIRLGRSVF